jgi:hypothetical protein
MGEENETNMKLTILPLKSAAPKKCPLPDS